MTYQEAIDKSLTVKWETGMCSRFIEMLLNRNTPEMTTELSS